MNCFCAKCGISKAGRVYIKRGYREGFCSPGCMDTYEGERLPSDGCCIMCNKALRAVDVFARYNNYVICSPKCQSVFIYSDLEDKVYIGTNEVQEAWRKYKTKAEWGTSYKPVEKACSFCYSILESNIRREMFGTEEKYFCDNNCLNHFIKKKSLKKPEAYAFCQHCELLRNRRDMTLGTDKRYYCDLQCLNLFLDKIGTSIETTDSVNHPAHYTSHPSGVECITITEHLNFLLGNAIKYIWRADLKNGTEDLEKAIWYLNRELKKRSKTDAKRTEKDI